LPAVAFVFYERLQDGERGGFVADDFAEEWGDAGKVGDFGEEAADFGVRVFTGLNAAEEF
jgi:hypothetical protein